MALVNDLHGVLLVLSLSGEGEGVLGLAIRNFVDPKYKMRIIVKEVGWDLRT